MLFHSIYIHKERAFFMKKIKYLKREGKTGPKIVDYSGQNLGKLIILYYENGRWICECSCGNKAIIRVGDITNERRFACKSCTASHASAMRNHNYDHYGYKKRIYREYIRGAKKRGFEFDIGFDEFNTLITSNCYYCGGEPTEKPNKNYMIKTIEPLKVCGVDRIDPKQGYVEDNFVSCCSKCNYAKHEMNKDEFFLWIKRIYNYNFL